MPQLSLSGLTAPGKRSRRTARHPHLRANLSWARATAKLVWGGERSPFLKHHPSMALDF